MLVAEAIVAGLAQVLLQGFLAAGRPGVATMVLAAGPGRACRSSWSWCRPTASAARRSRCWAARRCASSFTLSAYRSIRLPAPRVWITGDDLVDLARYRGALVSSIARLRASGGVE